MGRARKQPASQGEFKCPECGRTFGRAAALGAHRRRAHGVVGATARTRSASGSSRRSRRTTASRARATTATASRDGRRRSSGGANRDALLAALFPNGIPPREDVIRAVNQWLDEGERLAGMR